MVSGLLGRLAAVLVAAAGTAHAQYPARPITLVVPFTLGTGIDILARAIGQRLTERWGQAVVVDNRPGASGNIGYEAAAKAPPDGYTLLVSAASLATNAALAKTPRYDPQKSFAPVILLATGTMSLLVAAELPPQSVRDFVAYARTRPGALNYGSSGNGTLSHLAMELFKRDTGIEIVHVPYKGTAGAYNDAAAGRLAALFMPIHSSLPYVKQGKLRMLAVIAHERARLLPDVPTMAEAGFPNIDLENWYGLLAPAGTRAEVVARLNDELDRALANAAFRDVLTSQGLNPLGGPPARVGAVIDAELARWRRIVAASGIQAD